MNARDVDGTLSFSLETHSHPQNSYVFKHVAVLTLDGNLSILCASERCTETPILEHSGIAAGISSSITNLSNAIKGAFWFSRFGWKLTDGGQPCGCDPKIMHMCEQCEADCILWMNTEHR